MTVDSAQVHDRLKNLINDMAFKTEESLASLQREAMSLKHRDKLANDYNRTLALLLVDKGRDLKLIDGLDDKAYMVFEAVLLIDPDNADAHYHQAWLDYFKENVEGAIMHFEVALTQQSLNATLRMRALCKLALLYASLESLDQADSKVREAVSLLSSANLAKDRELETLVDITVFMIEQAHGIMGRITELSKPTPYLGIDIDGDQVLTSETADEWLDFINQGFIVLDLRKARAFLNTSKDAIGLNQRESHIISLLMQSKGAVSTRRILESVWNEEYVQLSVVKTALNRIRKKIGAASDASKDVIVTTKVGYQWNPKYLWKIIKYIG